jgi:hypothetical protein
LIFCLKLSALAMRRFAAFCLLLAVFPALIVQGNNNRTVSIADDVQQPLTERVRRSAKDQQPLPACLDTHGWTFLPSVQRYYRVIFELVDWDTAGERCREHGSKSHLVVVENAAENQAIKEFLSSIDPRLSRICKGPKAIWPTGNWYAGYWTSGQKTDRTQCRTPWVWKPYPGTSLTVTFTDFAHGEPNCHNGRETCFHYFDEPQRFRWNDINCDWPLCALCELDL